MTDTFDLITKPWINVTYLNNSSKTISLDKLFTDANEIKELNGDSKVQDLSILRLLLAILTTVYNKTSDPMQTWKTLYQIKKFDDVITYLNKHKDQFDFLGNKPFYQVNKETFSKYAKISPTTGTLLIKQLNRNVNESNSSLNTTSYISNLSKNKIKLPELIRWIITYQNVSAVTDKVKIDKTQAIDSGVIASIRPLYLKGTTLAETLVLNLILKPNQSAKPIWEQDSNSYIKHRVNDYYPDNIPEWYTTLSRMIYIEYTDNQPLIHVAGFPKLDLVNQFIEPMTTWNFVSHKGKDPINGFLPESFNLKSNKYQRALWRSFGLYVNENQKEDHLPGIIQWIHKLEEEEILPIDFKLPLASIVSVNNGGATSQTPILEITDQLKFNLNLAFENQFVLNDLITKLQTAGSLLGLFGTNIDKLYGTSTKNQIIQTYYQILNDEFNYWFENLTNDNFNPSIWNDKIIKLANKIMFDIMQNLQFKLDANEKSMFDYKNLTIYKIRKAFND